MACKISSRVLPEISPLSYDLLLTSSAPCDFEIEVTKESYSLKILSFEEYLMSISDKTALKTLYSLDCKCSSCTGFNLGHALLWSLKHYDVSNDDEMYIFDSIWEYIKYKFPLFSQSIISSEFNETPIPPTPTTQYPIYYGPSSATVVTEANVLALPFSVTDIVGEITLDTGTVEILFNVVIPQSISITNVTDVSSGWPLTSQYVLIGTVDMLNADTNTYTYDIYEMSIAVPYTSNEKHLVTL